MDSFTVSAKCSDRNCSIDQQHVTSDKQYTTAEVCAAAMKYSGQFEKCFDKAWSGPNNPEMYKYIPAKFKSKYIMYSLQYI